MTRDQLAVWAYRAWDAAREHGYPRRWEVGPGVHAALLAAVPPARQVPHARWWPQDEPRPAPTPARLLGIECHPLYCLAPHAWQVVGERRVPAGMTGIRVGGTDYQVPYGYRDTDVPLSGGNSAPAVPSDPGHR